MKILFADKFPASFAEQLTHEGHNCGLDSNLTAEDLPAAIGDAEVLVVRSTKVTADTIHSANRLRLIIRAGAGTNTIDKATAAAQNVYVCNVPGKNAIAVAELTMGLIIAIDRNLPDNVAQLRAGVWNKKKFSEATGLFGRSIGLVGMGAIGLAVVERAHAFGMKVHVIARPNRSADACRCLRHAAVTEVEDLTSLASSCDILSFHVPAGEDTRGLVDDVLLAAMKPGSILINTSRGDIIDEPALIRAMDEKGIRAGLDVYMNEPGSGQADFESALARHPNVYGTHHIGASTQQAQTAVAEGVVDIIRAFREGDVKHCVNMIVNP